MRRRKFAPVIESLNSRIVCDASTTYGLILDPISADPNGDVTDFLGVWTSSTVDMVQGWFTGQGGQLPGVAPPPLVPPIIPNVNPNPNPPVIVIAPILDANGVPQLPQPDEWSGGTGGGGSW